MQCNRINECNQMQYNGTVLMQHHTQPSSAVVTTRNPDPRSSPPATLICGRHHPQPWSAVVTTRNPAPRSSPPAILLHGRHHPQSCSTVVTTRNPAPRSSPPAILLHGRHHPQSCSPPPAILLTTTRNLFTATTTRNPAVLGIYIALPGDIS